MIAGHDLTIQRQGAAPRFQVNRFRSNCAFIPFHSFQCLFHFFIRIHLVQCLYARSRKSRHVQDLLEDLLQPCQEMEAQQARSPLTYDLIFVCPIHS